MVSVTFASGLFWQLCGKSVTPKKHKLRISGCSEEGKKEERGSQSDGCVVQAATKREKDEEKGGTSGNIMTRSTAAILPAVPIRDEDGCSHSKAETMTIAWMVGEEGAKVRLGQRDRKAKQAGKSSGSEKEEEER